MCPPSGRDCAVNPRTHWENGKEGVAKGYLRNPEDSCLKAIPTRSKTLRYPLQHDYPFPFSQAKIPQTKTLRAWVFWGIPSRTQELRPFQAGRRSSETLRSPDAQFAIDKQQTQLINTQHNTINQTQHNTITQTASTTNQHHKTTKPKTTNQPKTLGLRAGRYIYIYIYIEREREREIGVYIYIYIYQ